jgi:hypothetical protein
MIRLLVMWVQRASLGGHHCSRLVVIPKGWLTQRFASGHDERVATLY